jgi:hypothetical protein
MHNPPVPDGDAVFQQNPARRAQQKVSGNVFWQGDEGHLD